MIRRLYRWLKLHRLHGQLAEAQGHAKFYGTAKVARLHGVVLHRAEAIHERHCSCVPHLRAALAALGKAGQP